MRTVLPSGISVSSPFFPLMATEVRLSTEPVGLTLKVASRPFLTLSSAGGFAPLPSFVIFTVTVLAAESNLTHLPSLCVLLALSSAASAAGAASRQAAKARAKTLRRAKIGIGSPPVSGAVHLRRGPAPPGADESPEATRSSTLSTRRDSIRRSDRALRQAPEGAGAPLYLRPQPP